MITNISIKNFRSIESLDITLAPITILCGPTASGKSSLLYATQVLRNFVLNPTRQADGYFHLGFMDLGGFEACAFDHSQTRNVGVAITHEKDGGRATYGLTFGKSEGTIHLKAGPITMQAKIAIPYALNQSFPSSYKETSGTSTEEYTINWNGIACSVVPKAPTAETQQKAQEIAISVNAASEALKGIDIAPHRRGFFKPNYTPIAVSTIPTTEDEVGSIIINDQHLAGRISVYTEDIFGRDFRLHTLPGTSTVFFQTTDKKSRVPVYLVNDGFGVNQVIYLLAKMHRPEVHTILIEEPEVHLHPTALRKFARALCDFARDEQKQIIFTTHSDMFLSSILTVVSEGNLKADEIKCYLVTKEKKTTLFKEQKVQENGQIEGGLSSFAEAEYEDLKKLLGVQ